MEMMGVGYEHWLVFSTIFEFLSCLLNSSTTTFEREEILLKSLDIM